MINQWDERYNIPEYRYGETPNLFFKEMIDRLTPGKILLPADGEGRNSVYAAQTGWSVDAFDQSSLAKEKAVRLSLKRGSAISYKVMGFEDMEKSYAADSYDVIALTYVHLPHLLREEYYKKLLPLLKKGGYIILEGFSKNHVKNQQQNPQAGGPPDVNMLYSKDEIARIFGVLDIQLLQEQEVELSEGAGHHGKAFVIRFVGKKL